MECFQVLLSVFNLRPDNQDVDSVQEKDKQSLAPGGTKPVKRWRGESPFD
jgi:hypothetical protein